jgi:glycosyltransferase involved in cell wall biosynthesis
MRADITVDIVIPTFQRVETLRRTLESLAAVNIPSEIKNIIVVENGPKEGVDEIVKSYEGSIPVKYRYSDSAGLSHARNLGVESSRAEFIIFFDNDLTFYDFTLPAYVKAFKEHGERYFYGGPLEPDYELRPPDWLSEFLPRSARGFSLGDHDSEIDGPEFLGGNHAICRQHICDFGFYDAGGADGHNAGMVGEETRLQEKLLENGVRAFYVSRALVKHFVPRENCTPDWVLDRAHRQGVTTGVIRTEAHVFSRFFLGVPLYYWRELGSSCARLVFLRVLFKAQCDYFPVQYKFRTSLGVVRGYLSGEHQLGISTDNGN